MLKARALLLRGLACVYLWAFASAFVQWRGLFGRHGLEPVSAWLFSDADARSTVGVGASVLRALAEAVAAAGPQLGTSDVGTADADSGTAPSATPSAPPSAAVVDALCEMLCLFGMAMSLVAFACTYGAPSARLPARLGALSLWAALWAAYLVLQQVGRTFMSFQWDLLLLESGFLATLHASALAPRSSTYAMRFLLFKLMFMSGAVKIQSGCPTWLGLTALEYHYATQCLPTPLAWLAHQGPRLLGRLSVAATLVIELPLACWILSPLREHRVVAFAAQAALQLLIMLSGNYTFFNVLTLALCLSLLEGDGRLPASAFAAGTVRAIVVAAAAGPTLWFVLDRMLHVAAGAHADSESKSTPPLTFDLDLELTLTPAALQQHLAAALPVLLAVHAAQLLYAGLRDVASAASTASAASAASAASGAAAGLREGAPPRAVRAAVAVAAAAVVACASLAGFVPLASLDLPSLRAGPSPSGYLPPSVLALHGAATRIGGVSSGYGLFRSMTGVAADGSVARPEVVFEAAFASGEAATSSDTTVVAVWEELAFPYKPGRLDAAPRFVFPYQPRLDWQMWFAALSSYQQQPWVVHLAHKLLLGPPTAAGSDVAALFEGALGASINASRVPVAIRARLYDYDFALLGMGVEGGSDSRLKLVASSASSAALGAASWDALKGAWEQRGGDWWTRRLRGEYLPEITRGDASVKAFLQAHGWETADADDGVDVRAEVDQSLPLALREAVLQVARAVTSTQAAMALLVLAFGPTIASGRA